MAGFQQRDADDSGLSEVVVKIHRCATVVRGGRRFGVGSLLVVGCRDGMGGVGYGMGRGVAS